MAQVGAHPNLVALIGVHTTSMERMIVLSFCEHGSMLSLLQDKNNAGNPADASFKLNMMLEVASGMAHLHSKSFVHRDLAARNVLVATGMKCKVADFGLSRVTTKSSRDGAGDDDYDGGGGDGSEDQYYRSAAGMFPLRWTPPESMVSMRFNQASDVWSFGVTFHECFSDGGKPYAGMSNVETMTKVQSGYKLPCPSSCPNNTYAVMLQCLESEPQDRPSFKALVQSLANIAAAPEVAARATTTNVAEVPYPQPRAVNGIANTSQVAASNSSGNFGNYEGVGGYAAGGGGANSNPVPAEQGGPLLKVGDYEYVQTNIVATVGAGTDSSGAYEYVQANTAATATATANVAEAAYLQPTPIADPDQSGTVLYSLMQADTVQQASGGNIAAVDSTAADAESSPYTMFNDANTGNSGPVTSTAIVSPGGGGIGAEDYARTVNVPKTGASNAQTAETADYHAASPGEPLALPVQADATGNPNRAPTVGDAATAHDVVSPRTTPPLPVHVEVTMQGLTSLGGSERGDNGGNAGGSGVVVSPAAVRGSRTAASARRVQSRAITLGTKRLLESTFTVILAGKKSGSKMWVVVSASSDAASGKLEIYESKSAVTKGMPKVTIRRKNIVTAERTPIKAKNAVVIADAQSRDASNQAARTTTFVSDDGQLLADLLAFASSEAPVISAESIL